MWKIDDFNKWIKNERPINENIIELDISQSNIKILGNLENLVNLEILNCDNNFLSSLEGIEKLINLEFLSCGYNQLTSLERIENLINLEYLDCSYNQLTLLEEIENLTNLKNFYCYNNSLTSLKSVENLNNLKALYCYDNLLTSLEGIENLTNLIKNNKKIIKELNYDFIDSDDYIELNDLFNNLIKCKNNNKIDKNIENIEKMIIELNGFQKYVLK
jgi:internalin A